MPWTKPAHLHVLAKGFNVRLRKHQLNGRRGVFNEAIASECNPVNMELFRSIGVLNEATASECNPVNLELFRSSGVQHAVHLNCAQES
jgi:hypothetical protein